MSQVLRRSMRLVLLAVAAFVVALFAGAGFYTDWLWFRGQGYDSAFWTIILTQWELRGVVGLAFFVFLFVNLWWTRKSIGDVVQRLDPDQQYLGWLTAKRVTLVFGAAAILVGLMGSSAASIGWEVVRKFLAPSPFGVTDPLFGKDVGFYVFQLPFYQFAYKLAMSLLVVTLLAVGAMYLASGSFGFERTSVVLKGRARIHISSLLALVFLLKAWGYQLGMYELLYSQRGTVFGAGYTDVHANLFALKALFWIAIICAVLVFLAVFAKRTGLLVGGVGLLAAASVVLGSVYPGLLQRFSVEPNELVRETPYIDTNIKYTRLAYGLSNITEQFYPAREDLTYEDILSEPATLANVRLWDWRPLLSTYSQLQEMRLYYDFNEVDVDRYVLDGNLRQVTLAPRELNVNQIATSAQTWINLKLKFTHGYGAVISPVNEVTTEGLPMFFTKDIPPVSSKPALAITRPALYYGELATEPVYVNTRAKEFDYPLGDDNAYTHYDGKGGVQLSSLVTRAAFAIRFGDLKMMLSSDITPETRVLLYRQIGERVRRIAPFLKYDRDPYLVISKGRMYYIQDAYVTTDLYPYATPTPGWGNYIRNSVKAIIDAYDGTTTFYVMDPREPLAKTYSKIFPGLFRPVSDMPADLRAHIRYPEDLFRVQAYIYSTYHMNDPTVFYNKEDVWTISGEVVGNERTAIEPYYVVMTLPGEKKPEFVLLLPFSPSRKNNLVAWMAARSDGENYGKVLLYKFSKEKLTFGPMQVEARIDQDPVISQNLSLWDQKGSNVIRGNLLVIPVAGGLLYVEPLYLQAQQSQMPELKQVIVAYGGKVAMATDLGTALAQLFNVSPQARRFGPGTSTGGATGTATATGTGSAGGAAAVAGVSPVPSPGATASLDQLITAANDLYRDAQSKARNGDWAGYGRSVEELGRTLDRMRQLSR